MLKTNKATAIYSLILCLGWILIGIFNTTPDRFDYLLLVAIVAIEMLIDSVYYYTGTSKAR